LILLAVLVWGARSGSNPVQLLLWWLCLPLATAWLFSLRRPSYVDRYFEPAIISVALLAAVGLATLPRWGKRIGIVLAVGGMLLASARLSVDPKFAKEDWRGGAQLIQVLGLRVGISDLESPLALSPYVSPQYEWARTEAELSEQLAKGPLVLVLRSPHESAHALSKSAPFDPLTEGPSLLKQWLRDNPSVPAEVCPFTGLALIILGK
jgi:hypothetical protein